MFENIKIREEMSKTNLKLDKIEGKLNELLKVIKGEKKVSKNGQNQVK